MAFRFVVAVFLLTAVHWLPAPVIEVPESTPTPKQKGDTARPKPEEIPKPKAKHASPTETAREASPKEGSTPGQRQLDSANALFARKLFDVAVPEYQKYLDQFPTGSGRANAYFCLGECFRTLNNEKFAHTNFQIVLDKFGESEFTGLAAYRVAESHFTQKEFGAALPLFHRAAAKVKEPSAALSARYFEARCLEALDRKSEARDLYLQIVDAKNPNPYREDSRRALGF